MGKGVWLNAEKNKPQQEGWWPVTLLFDAEEGFIPSASYWDGSEWTGATQKAIAFYWPKRCVSKEEAEGVAYENDFEGSKYVNTK